jgi:hypothetical protein
MRARTLVAALALAAPLATAASSGPMAPAPAAAVPTGCTGTVVIAQLRFHPHVVPPGASSTAVLVADNCTARRLTTSVQWEGRYVGPGPGLPPGCPAIDPIAMPADFPPHGSLTSSVTYTVLAGCRASSLRVTAMIRGSSGRLLAQESARLIVQLGVG